MRRNPVALIWLAGMLVAVVAYVADPGRLFRAALDMLASIAMGFEHLLQSLTQLGGDVLRALAIGLFVTFVALTGLAIRQGHRGRAALVFVSLAFVLLVHDDGTGISNERWVTAFALAAIGSLVMTNRVRRSIG
jgi:hypothetical protein